MFRAPFTKVLLRDNFAANIMCSFSPVIAGVLYCGCYFGTGAFLYTADPNHDTGNEKYHTCASSDTVRGLVVLCFCIPLCIRLFQCLRQLYEYKVAPWTQPANNTTVDYSQQTSLDPSEDPTTEWGHTWLSPMMGEFDKMNQSNNSSDSSGGGDGSGKGGVILQGVQSMNEIESSMSPHTEIISNHAINADDFQPSPSAYTTTDKESVGDTGLRARPRGFSSAPRLLNDVSHITEAAEEVSHSPHNGTPPSIHSSIHTGSKNTHLSTSNRDNANTVDKAASGKSKSTSPVPSSSVKASSKTSNKSTNSNKTSTEWGNTFFNPLFGAHAKHNNVDDTDNSNGSNEHDSNDESHSSHVDSFHFSNAFAHGGIHTHRSANSLRSIVRKICATPIKILSPYYYSLRTHTDPWCARFKTVWIWPHAQNAFQYILQIMVVLIGAFPPQDPSGAAYITCFSLFLAFTVVYVSYWDIVVDCQLLQADSEKPFLRKKLYYEEYEIFYYAFLFFRHRKALL
eukprot:gene28283-31943_t